MATTSMTLGQHWEGFIRQEIESGRYHSASEVVRAALRELEDKSRSHEALRSHLEQGAKQAASGIFVDKWSAADIVARAEGRRG